ncbi:hypothetical protein N7449_010359 [Penicillium cf. viridicatum]|uniref:Major facilitator superfamily (MFS) profile domain-containing protein n=1 Tax=Penicillium cf. viridicatum TaxID=2972119 RepID=A0A9W9J313_9EURO|nr:hypothetical protein N7449_010359 [Penicillium cf. viridicatum]
MMLSLCSEFWQIVLAQGFVVGIGTGCLFVPCVAITPQYLTTEMGAAMGAVASGSALGGVIYPIILYRLINQIGFPWAVRVIGFIALGTLFIPVSIMRLRMQPPKVRAMVDPTVQGPRLFVILFYLSFFTEATRITDSSLAFYMVSTFNAASVFGRTILNKIPNKLADRFGRFNLLVPAALSSGMLMVCMMTVHSKAAVIVMTILSGSMSGALIGLPPMCLAILTADKSKLGTRVGMGYAITALGVLASGPSSGAILRNGGASLDWHSLCVCGGVPTCVSGLGYAAIRIFKYGLKLNIKA